jgi:hypothetical protein
LKGLWKNANPEPTSAEILAARKLGIIESHENALKNPKEFWRENRVEGCDRRNFEAALVRIDLNLRREKDKTRWKLH